MSETLQVPSDILLRVRLARERIKELEQWKIGIPYELNHFYWFFVQVLIRVVEFLQLFVLMLVRQQLKNLKYFGARCALPYVRTHQS